MESLTVADRRSLLNGYLAIRELMNGLKYDNWRLHRPDADPDQPSGCESFEERTGPMMARIEALTETLCRMLVGGEAPPANGDTERS